MKTPKIAVIGAGGKITTAVMLELAVFDRETPLHFALHGRNAGKIAHTQALIGAHAAQSLRMTEHSLDEALDGADIVLYCASYGYGDCGKWKSMGVGNGAHLMDIGERMARLCPEAWLLVVTNPPDVPLGAIARRFGLTKLIGLCNASVFTRKVLSAYLGCAESDLVLRDIGVNHELWYADILLRGVSIYDELRRSLPAYRREAVQGRFHDHFPEWRAGFANNVELMERLGYLTAPVGGGARYTGTRTARSEIAALMKRPTAADFAALTPEMDTDALLLATRRCAAEFPIYIADVIRSLLYGDGRSHSVQVPNGTDFPGFPADVMLQRSVRFASGGWVSDPMEVPDFIRAALVGRAEQFRLLAHALADQDAAILRQALMLYPERVCDADGWMQEVLSGTRSVEPEIVVN